MPGLRDILDAATPGPWAWPHNNALAGDYADGYDSKWSLIAAIHDAGPVTNADARHYGKCSVPGPEPQEGDTT